MKKSGEYATCGRTFHSNSVSVSLTIFATCDRALSCKSITFLFCVRFVVDLSVCKRLETIEIATFNVSVNSLSVWDWFWFHNACNSASLNFFGWHLDISYLSHQNHHFWIIETSLCILFLIEQSHHNFPLIYSMCFNCSFLYIKVVVENMSKE